jgi:hypothetical protein
VARNGNHFISLHIAIHHAENANCELCVSKKPATPWRASAWHKRCFNLNRGVKNMKKYLLLPLVALGLVAWTPTPAKAAVHFSFGFGVPGYYGYYGPYYGYDGPYYGHYPGYSYYYHPYPYWHRHHYYYHRWHRW